MMIAVILFITDG